MMDLAVITFDGVKLYFCIKRTDVPVTCFLDLLFYAEGAIYVFKTILS